MIMIAEGGTIADEVQRMMMIIRKMNIHEEKTTIIHKMMPIIAERWNDIVARAIADHAVHARSMRIHIIVKMIVAIVMIFIEQYGRSGWIMVVVWMGINLYNALRFKTLTYIYYHYAICHLLYIPSK